MVQHPAEMDDVVLFSFRSKAFFGKKKVSDKVLVFGLIEILNIAENHLDAEFLRSFLSHYK